VEAGLEIVGLDQAESYHPVHPKCPSSRTGFSVSAIR